MTINLARQVITLSLLFAASCGGVVGLDHQQPEVGGAHSAGGANSEGGDRTAIGGNAAEGGQSNVAAPGCLYNGSYFSVGAGFRSADGCNSCSCELFDGSAIVWCTEMDCIPTPAGGTSSLGLGGAMATGGRTPSSTGGATWKPTGGNTSQSMGGSVVASSGGAVSMGGAVATGGMLAAGGTAGSSGSACVMPPDVGPCDAAMPKYYFSVLTSRCEMFTYGGCGGNGNRFDTLADCENSCRNNPKLCPTRVPPSGLGLECMLGSVCYYRTINSCLCTFDGLSCTQYDSSCPNSTTDSGTGGASSSATMPAAGSAGVAAPQTYVCSCGTPGWVCGFNWGLP